MQLIFDSGPLGDRIARLGEGQLPELVSLTDNGRAKGLFGSQILEWKQKRIAAAAKMKKAG